MPRQPVFLLFMGASITINAILPDRPVIMTIPAINEWPGTHSLRDGERQIWINVLPKDVSAGLGTLSPWIESQVNDPLHHDVSNFVVIYNNKKLCMQNFIFLFILYYKEISRIVCDYLFIYITLCRAIPPLFSARSITYFDSFSSSVISL